jgi:GT2 family glycosyltransferase
MPEISTVILTYNSIKFIRSCLDSVFSQDYQDFEVVIIDNGSTDNTAGFIKENYPQVILIENKENLGTAFARNQGIEIAKGEWILTLDCDVILEKNFLHKIISFAERSRDSIDMIQPKILKDDKKTIYSCGIYLSKLRRFYDIGKGKIDNGQFNIPKYIFGACSAAALYKRRMLQDLKEETGYFDERFFFLVEDVDLAWRAQRKGWKALYYPEAVSYHYGNSSSLNRSLRQFLCWRNRKFLLRKCNLNKFKFATIYLVYDLPHLTFLFLINSYVRSEIKIGLMHYFRPSKKKINENGNCDTYL